MAEHPAGGSATKLVCPPVFHLRSFQAGKHSAESQELLNQIASAKINLLKPDKKVEYNRLLREQTELESESVLDEKSSARQEELSMTLYRLLGLRPLETNRNTIKTAAARRVAQLREFISSEYGTDAQKLLRQITSARLTLLDRKKKTEYDKLLRRQTVLTDEGSEPDEELSTTLAGFLGAMEAAEVKPVTRKSREETMPGAGKRKHGRLGTATDAQRRERMLMIGGAIAAGVLLLALVLALAVNFGGRPKEKSLEDSWLADTPDQSEPLPPAKPAEPTESKTPSPTAIQAEKPAQVPASASVTEGEKEITVDLGGGVKIELVYIPPGEFLMGSWASGWPWFRSM